MNVIRLNKYTNMQNSCIKQVLADKPAAKLPTASTRKRAKSMHAGTVNSGARANSFLAAGRIWPMGVLSPHYYVDPI